LNNINEEIASTEKFKNENFNQRNLETTYGSEFLKKVIFTYLFFVLIKQEVNMNSLGRKNMFDQNGNKLPLDCRDEDLLADHGLLQRFFLDNHNY